MPDRSTTPRRPIEAVTHLLQPVIDRAQREPDLVRSGEVGSHSTVLYAHPGGQPALGAYSSTCDS